MIRNALKSLQRKLARGDRHQAPAGAEHLRGSNPWHAVSIQPGAKRCEAATALLGRRFLSSEAPRLPLAACDEPACQCRFRKYDDRRTPGQALDHNGVPLPHPTRRDTD